MESTITELVNQYGYLGICFLIAIENIFPPIPSEVILTAGGYLTTVSDLTVTGVIISATLGSMIGAVVLYSIGKFMSAERLEGIIEGKIGRTLRLKTEDIGKAEYWFNRYGGKAVFFGRFIPLVRSLISIPAGIARMNFTKFFVLTLIGSLIWNTVLVNVGRVAGEAMDEFNAAFDVFSHVSYLIIAITALIAIIYFVKTRFFNKDK